MNTEDQINELLRRIEAIEKRQAKLACSETADITHDDGGNETEQWTELAKMLWFGYTDHDGFIDYEDSTYYLFARTTQAMLHGLACLEANGQIVEENCGFTWTIHDKGSGQLDLSDPEPVSLPAALIAMLRAYREASDA